MVLGQLIPTPNELLAGDVAPLGSPDSILTAGDLVVLSRAINGLVTLPNSQPGSPVLTVSSGSSDTNTYTVNGNTNAATQINLYVNNQLQGSTTSDGSGHFSITATLNEGSNTIYVTATIGGVESNPSATITITYDDFDLLMNVVVMLASLPRAPVLDTLSSPVDTPEVRVSGTATPGFGVNIYVNGVLKAQGTADASTGAFSITGAAVAKGVNTITARAVSPNGAAGIVSGKVTVVRSNQPRAPDLNRISLDFVSGGQIQIDGSAGATFGGFQVKISTNAGGNRTVTANADGSFSTTLSQNGASSLTFQVLDEDGVASLSVTRGIGSATEENLHAQVMAVWNAFCARLDSGDATGAVGYMSLASQSDYTRLFDVIGSEIRNLTGYWTSTIPIMLTNDYAEYALKQTVNGQTRLHIVGFSRDSNGQWVVEQL
jgi:hypothetical protein